MASAFDVVLMATIHRETHLQDIDDASSAVSSAIGIQWLLSQELKLRAASCLTISNVSSIEYYMYMLFVANTHLSHEVHYFLISCV